MPGLKECALAGAHRSAGKEQCALKPLLHHPNLRVGLLKFFEYLWKLLIDPPLRIL